MPALKQHRIALLTIIIILFITLYTLLPRTHITPQNSADPIIQPQNQPTFQPTENPASTNNLAPLTNCPPQIQDYTHIYEVTVKQGHTLTTLKNNFLNSEFHPHISHFPKLEQVVYVIGNVDSDLLAAIRSDAGVEMVRCESVQRLEEMTRTDPSKR